jgi:hypothetical protein
MPNAIKYNVSAETLALKKGNFYIGTGDVGKGPTSSTGFYNGITPPSGGYTIYLNKASDGPSIYTVSTVAELTGLTSTIAGQTLRTSGACFNYFATQTDKMIFNIDYPAIITSGLSLNLDAGFTPSYPTTATTWYDLSGNNNNSTLVNGPTYNTSQGGGIKFDATDDYATIPDSNSIDLTTLTISLWFNRGDILTLAAGDQQNFFLKGNTNAPGGDNFNYAVQLLGPTGGGRYAWQSPGISFAALIPPSQVLFANQWYNLVFTHVSTNTPIAYLNGIKQTNWTATNPTNALVTNTWRATISGDVERGQAATFNGIMSIVQLYNRALSETEVLQNWNALKGRFGL